MQTNKTNMTSLREAQELARELMNFHGLTDWSFQFNNAKRSNGKCSYNRKTIYLSAILTPLRPMNRVKNTILHEIAHALVGSRQGHNNIWKWKALEIGCDAHRCTSEGVDVQAKYIAECDCGVTHKAHRRPKRTHWCKCKGRAFNPNESLNYVQQY